MKDMGTDSIPRRADHRRVMGKKRALVGVVLGAGLTVGGAWLSRHAQAADSVAGRSATQFAAGQAAFEYERAACHGRERVGSNHGMLPATFSLWVKYHGAVPAALEDRTDLSAAYVKYIVRHGTALMPFFRPTMVSDQQLDEIAAYLSRPRSRVHASE